MEPYLNLDGLILLVLCRTIQALGGSVHCSAGAAVLFQALAQLFVVEGNNAMKVRSLGFGDGRHFVVVGKRLLKLGDGS